MPGPYFISNILADGQIELKKNKYCFDYNNVQPERILIRKTNHPVNLDDFVFGQTWDNKVQVSSFVSSKIAWSLQPYGYPLFSMQNRQMLNQMIAPLLLFTFLENWFLAK